MRRGGFNPFSSLQHITTRRDLPSLSTSGAHTNNNNNFVINILYNM